MRSFSINKRGYWESKDSSGHLYDEALSKGLISFFRSEGAKSLIDLGCGLGKYTRSLVDAGFACDGYDGNPNTVLLSEGFGRVLDFSFPFDLNKNYDWALSLEVGEHIPKKFETTFLDNVVNHAQGGIVISWAIPGQSGDGHVNCRSNKYIIHQLKRKGWNYDAASTSLLRKEATFGWFKNTLMVFRKMEIDDTAAKSRVWMSSYRKIIGKFSLRKIRNGQG